jgi:Pectate lyase superfamily protein
MPPTPALFQVIDAVAVYGIDQTGTVDVTPLIQQALNDAGANFAPTRVDLRSGRYLTSAPLSIPTGVTLSGPEPVNSGTGANINDDYGAVIVMAAYFGNPAGVSQPGALYINGNNTIVYRAGIQNLWIEGNTGAVGVHGISAFGGAYHCLVSHVGMRGIPQDGLHTQGDGLVTADRADGWTVEDLIVQTWGTAPSGGAPTAYGVQWQGQDTEFINAHVQNAGSSTTGGGGWQINNASNCRWVACRADQSADSGFITDSNPGGTSGTDSPGSSLTFVGCGTENNGNYGFRATNSSTTGGQERTPVLLIGCSFDFDGRLAPSGGGAGIRVEGNNVLEALGCDITCADNAYPQYGLVTASIGSGPNPPAYIRCQGGFWNSQATTPVNDTAGMNPLIDVDAVVGGPALAASTYTRYTSPAANAAQPSDAGYAGWTYDPASLPNNPTGVALGTSGTVYCWRVPIRSVQSFSNVRALLTAVGSTLTANECFAGVISAAGVLICTSADLSGSSFWGTGATVPAVQDYAMVGAPFLSYPPFVWIVMLFNGTTGPAFARTSNFSTALANGKAAATQLRYATSTTGQATLPASVTPGSMNAASNMYWGAIW